MRTILRIATPALAALALFAPASAQNSEDFSWSKVVAAGRTVEIRGTNGAIKAVATNGSEVRVEAKKTARRSNVADVRIEVVEHDGGVTLCAVYPTPPRARRPNQCGRGSEHNNSVSNNDVSVAWTVHVPRGVLLNANTVNGGISVEGLQADVKANTVNGDIDVASTGVVRANTVNGAITAVMGRAAWTGTLEFRSVNGGIDVTLPADLDTDVSASTVNGNITADWPLTVRGSFGSRSLRGTIGSGGRNLTLQTVNGGIAIRKR